MPRTYVQRARQETAAATRRRMIEAARAVLARGDLAKLDLADVAKEAGLARSTIYLSFGTRSAFIDEIVRDSLARAGFGRLGQYFMLPDAAEAMEKSLAQGAVVYAAEHLVLSRMIQLARLDKEAGALGEQRERNRMAGMRDLASRLRRQGKLRAGLSAETAASILWVLTSFDTFDQLHLGWGLDAKACGARLVALARGSLLEA